MTLAQEIYGNGELAARVRSVVVMFDYGSQKPVRFQLRFGRSLSRTSNKAASFDRSPLYLEHSLFTDQVRHLNVVRFAGQSRNDKFGRCDADNRDTFSLSQQPVIKASAVSQTVTGSVKREAGDEEQLEPL